ncbi:hypothetical protein BJ085DRAFT_27387 [Dimargaris cristalligena]|uniref:Uncharacterized protein n=1 Tax=Dimargaris cristalligena TaxID=215637 RepID=A0A4P9ZNH9_9FUNG|nr:hypothetical protein BJ085DRAFT_27387 [Dimargaris cristalligena]|eukprot:RKP34976.1 hypothetical protein BJ085DRAFT_27387 [Dimargaris cristalligena]
MFIHAPSLKWIALSLSLMIVSSNGASIQSQGESVSQLAKSVSLKINGPSPTDCEQLSELADYFRVPYIGSQPEPRVIDWSKLSDDQKSQNFPLLWCAPQKPLDSLAYIEGIQWLLDSQEDRLVDVWANQVNTNTPNVKLDTVTLEKYIGKTLSKQVLLAIVADPKSHNSLEQVLTKSLGMDIDRSALLAVLNNLPLSISRTSTLGENLLGYKYHMQKMLAFCAGLLGYSRAKLILDHLFKDTEKEVPEPELKSLDNQACRKIGHFDEDEVLPFTKAQKSFTVWLIDDGIGQSLIGGWASTIANLFTGRG